MHPIQEFLAHFVFKKKQYKTGKDLFNYLLMPLIGAGFTVLLWVHLASESIIGGIIWAAIGFVYMLFLTKFFTRDISSLGIVFPNILIKVNNIFLNKND